MVMCAGYFSFADVVHAKLKCPIHPPNFSILSKDNLTEGLVTRAVVCPAASASASGAVESRRAGAALLWEF